ncbi:unnamed protein product [Staurois parvus]|uniref:REV3-like, polymerase (DNA directed), zeta, catalytic subunit n=1 Tax=Staurois parvus TaxID=386267 RepID=A0ABN9CS60_9NEOB|nr:unnamed protein product [Staurois parvus]
MEEHAGRAAASYVCQDVSTARLFPKYSNDDGIYSNDSKGLCPISVRLKQAQSKTVDSPKLKNGLHSTVWNGEEQTSLDRDNLSKITVSMSQDLGSPSSSIPFSSLQLNTPNCKTSSFSNTNLKKPLTYLRKLVFDDLPQRRELGRLAPASTEHNVNGADGTTQPGQTNAIFSNFCHINGDLQDKNSEKTDSSLQFRKQGRNAADQILTRLHTRSAEDLNHPGTSCENTADVKLNYDSVDPNNVGSHLESQRNVPHTSVPCSTPDWVKQFQSDSPIHMCKSSETTALSHHESSLFNSLPSAVADHEEQADLFMAQSSTNRYNIDFNNDLHSNDLPCEEEVRPHAHSKNILFPGSISESSCLSSSQIYSGSPPAKRKLLNPCNNSPAKSSKH